jgi:hypothetical protein
MGDLPNHSTVILVPRLPGILLLISRILDISLPGLKVSSLRKLLTASQF